MHVLFHSVSGCYLVRADELPHQFPLLAQQLPLLLSLLLQVALGLQQLPCLRQFHLQLLHLLNKEYKQVASLIRPAVGFDLSTEQSALHVEQQLT